MESKSHAVLYSMLLEYLEQHGCSLAEYGSAERGLDINDAQAFLELLRINQVVIYGVELWRSLDGQLDLDISEIWYPGSADNDENYLDAERYFNCVKTGDGDVFAIQFA